MPSFQQLVKCPHCSLPITLTSDFTDGEIFVHGKMKKNGQSIKNGLPAEWYQYLRDNNLVYGCAKPYIVVRHNSVYYEAVPFKRTLINTRRQTIIPQQRVNPNPQIFSSDKV